MKTCVCEKCLHIDVCGKYAATGGYVYKCENLLEKKTGRWVREEGETELWCSECGMPAMGGGRIMTDYCHNCGAKMDEEVYYETN